jgi:hypothetical protein
MSNRSERVAQTLELADESGQRVQRVIHRGADGLVLPEQRLPEQQLNSNN